MVCLDLLSINRLIAALELIFKWKHQLLQEIFVVSASKQTVWFHIFLKKIPLVFYPWNFREILKAQTEWYLTCIFYLGLENPHVRNLFLPIKNFSPSHKNVFLHKVETCRSIGLCYTSSKEIIFVFNTSSDIKMS